MTAQPRALVTGHRWRQGTRIYQNIPESDFIKLASVQAALGDTETPQVTDFG